MTAAEDKLLDMGLLADRLWALELGILRANVLQAAAGQKGVAGCGLLHQSCMFDLAAAATEAAAPPAAAAV